MEYKTNNDLNLVLIFMNEKEMTFFDQRQVETLKTNQVKH